MSKLGGLIVTVKSKLEGKEHKDTHVKVAWFDSQGEVKTSRERNTKMLVSKWGGLTVMVKSKLVGNEHKDTYLKVGWFDSQGEVKTSRERTQRQLSQSWVV